MLGGFPPTMSSPPVPLGGQQDEREPDVPLGMDLGGRGVRPLASEHGDASDAAGGDGVEGEAPVRADQGECAKLRF